MTKPRLGGMLAPPPRFEPTEQYSDRLYLYRIDRARGICKVTIINDAATRPAGYYALAQPQPIVAPVATPHPDQTAMVSARVEPAAPPPAIMPHMVREIRLPSLPHIRIPKLPKFRKLQLPRVRFTRETKFTKPPHKGVRKSLVAAASMVATAAAFLVIYPLYPAIQYNVGQTLSPAAINASSIAGVPVASGNELRIPKIGVRTPVLESDSLEILNKKEGVWHQSGTLGADNFVLAGHRWKYLPPNTSTFYNLDKLAEGDTIVIDWFQKRYLFTVRQVLTVSQDRTDLIQPTAQPRITLYTCNDKKETERIVVIAEPEQ